MKNRPPMDTALVSADSSSALRGIAAGAGDWSLIAVREVRRILEEEEMRRPQAVSSGLDELQKRDLISAEESEILKRIVEAFFEALGTKEAPGRSQSEIWDCYSRLSLDPGASPVAVGIASVAARHVMAPSESMLPSTQSDVVPFVSITVTPKSTGSGAIVGAVVGAGIGGAAGGIVGAAIGTLIGAAAGAAIGFSNENQT